MNLADQILFGSRELDRIITDIQDMIGIIMSLLKEEDRMVNRFSGGEPTQNPPFNFESIYKDFDFGRYKWNLSANRSGSNEGSKLVWLKWRIKCWVVSPDGTNAIAIIDSYEENGGIDRHLFPKEYALGTYDTLRSLFPELAKVFPFLNERWAPMLHAARVFGKDGGRLHE